LTDCTVRQIEAADYRDIYVLNQDFNPDLRLFTEDRVKKRIEAITAQTKDVIFLYASTMKKSSDTFTAVLMSCSFPTP